MNTHKRKQLRRACIIIAICLLGGIGYIIFSIAHDFPGYMAMVNRNTDLNKQHQIGDAIVAYLKSHEGNLPESISVLVDGRLLPSSSSIYASPYHREKQRNTSYKEASYYIVSENDGAEPFFYVRRRLQNENSNVPDGYFEVNAQINDALRAFKNSKK